MKNAWKCKYGKMKMRESKNVYGQIITISRVDFEADILVMIHVAFMMTRFMLLKHSKYYIIKNAPSNKRWKVKRIKFGTKVPNRESLK